MVSKEYVIRYYIEGELTEWEPNKYFSTEETELYIPEQTGYTFDGWYNNADYSGEIVNSIPEGSVGAMDLFGRWTPNPYTITMYPNGGDVPQVSATVTYDNEFNLPVPTKTGYKFLGWYYGQRKITDEYGVGLQTWNIADNITVEAKYEPIKYKIFLDLNEGDTLLGDSIIEVEYDSEYQLPTATYYGGAFLGWYQLSYRGTQYTDKNGKSLKPYTIAGDTVMYANWDYYLYNIRLVKKHSQEPDTHYVLISFPRIYYETSYTFTADDEMTYQNDVRLFTDWQIIRGFESDFSSTNQWETYSTEKDIEFSPKIIRELFYHDLKDNNTVTIRARYATAKNTCIAEGTLITLADGTQKPVEKLTGDEQLLVWNFEKGIFDTAPILFVDSDKQALYEVVYLHFADGGIVKVLTEHAFWDFDLNKFIYLRNDAAKYIGHYFNKQTTDKDGNLTYCKVQLVSVEIREEQTTAWSPLTYGYMGYYVNGMLSMPGAGESFINIFEVDSETMTYDKDSMEEDIMTYDLYTYEEFAELVPVSREVFEAFNGKYLKISIAKGNTTIERILELVEIYKEFLQ